MSEEILAQESEETAEEEVIEPSEQDSSDDLTEEEVEEGKTAKASVKKEEDDDEEDEDDSEEEDPAEEKKVKKEAVSIPKTKNQMLKNIYDNVNGMLKGDLATKYEEIMSATNLESIKEEEVKEDNEVRTKVAIK